MSKTENRVEIIGHVGRNPNIHYTGQGAIIASFTIATSEPYKDTQGNWQKRPEWHSLVAFRRNAELIRDFIRQGSKMRVVGRLRTRTWDDRQTGKKQYKTEILANDIMFLSTREDSADKTDAAAVIPEPTGTVNEPPYTDAEISQYDTESEEIPF